MNKREWDSMTYVRCSECSFVYDSKLMVCPQCGAPKVVTESLDGETSKEDVFNICD